MKAGLFLRPISVLVAAGWMAVSAVDGISVCTHNGTSQVQYYGPKDGKLLRFAIKNNVITQHELNAGPCSNPKISPSGQKVAFIRNSRLMVMNMTGGTATELTSCFSNSQIDFPNETWVYFTGGDFHTSNKTLKRVNVGTKTVETVVTFQWRTAQFFISNDLSRAVMRVGDGDGTVTGTVIAYDMPGNGSGFRITSDPGWSCASGLSSDGQYILDGDPDPHASMVVRQYSGGSPTAEVSRYTNQTALGWAPNSNSYKPSSFNHSIFHSGMAANNPNWICLAMGGSRDYASNAQVLVNWKDKQCIVPTKELTGKFCHGDFWVGDPNTILGPSLAGPVARTQRIDGQPAKVTVSLHRDRSIENRSEPTGSTEVFDARGNRMKAETAGNGLRFVRYRPR